MRYTHIDYLNKVHRREPNMFQRERADSKIPVRTFRYGTAVCKSLKMETDDRKLST